MEQKRLWCRQIKETILDNYNAVIPDKAKEIVMMLGKSQGEGKTVIAFEQHRCYYIFAFSFALVYSRTYLCLILI